MEFENETLEEQLDRIEKELLSYGQKVGKCGYEELGKIETRIDDIHETLTKLSDEVAILKPYNEEI
jgi:archaellum component FlaC